MTNAKGRRQNSTSFKTAHSNRIFSSFERFEALVGSEARNEKRCVQFNGAACIQHEKPRVQCTVCVASNEMTDSVRCRVPHIRQEKQQQQTQEFVRIRFASIYELGCSRIAPRLDSTVDSAPVGQL